MRSSPARSSNYTVSNKNLATYLVPQRPVTITAETLHESGRGVSYTKAAFAYLFQHVG